MGVSENSLPGIKVPCPPSESRQKEQLGRRRLNRLQVQGTSFPQLSDRGLTQAAAAKETSDAWRRDRVTHYKQSPAEVLILHLQPPSPDADSFWPNMVCQTMEASLAPAQGQHPPVMASDDLLFEPTAPAKEARSSRFETIAQPGEVASEAIRRRARDQQLPVIPTHELFFVLKSSAKVKSSTGVHWPEGIAQEAAARRERLLKRHKRPMDELLWEPKPLAEETKSSSSALVSQDEEISPALEVRGYRRPLPSFEVKVPFNPNNSTVSNGTRESVKEPSVRRRNRRVELLQSTIVQPLFFEPKPPAKAETCSSLPKAEEPMRTTAAVRTRVRALKPCLTLTDEALYQPVFIPTRARPLRNLCKLHAETEPASGTRTSWRY